MSMFRIYVNGRMLKSLATAKQAERILIWSRQRKWRDVCAVKVSSHVDKA